MNINILMIDDEPKNTQAVKDIFDGECISGHNISIEISNDFDKGKELLFSRKDEFDIVILDIFRGIPSNENPDKDGELILTEIRSKTFIPVIFFSGLTKHVQELESEIIRVVSKTAGGNEILGKEIESLIETGIPLLKKNLYAHVNNCTREYFWDFVQNNWDELKHIKDNTSLGYLLARRIAKTLSKSRVKEILNDNIISKEKIYPMEFYIHPIHNKSIETGDILKKDGCFFVILTPSCHIAQGKTDYFHLAKCIPLEETKEYKDYKKESDKKTPDNDKLNSRKNVLSQLIRSGRRDCHFFLPKTTFIDNVVIDFEQLFTIHKENLSEYERIAKLDSPYAQSMIVQFIRNYNRVGTDDLDSEYIIGNLS